VASKEQCQKQLFNLGIKWGVSPKLIALRLLSAEDKNDMLADLVPKEALDCHVGVWSRNGMPDYANGNTGVPRDFVVK